MDTRKSSSRQAGLNEPSGFEPLKFYCILLALKFVLALFGLRRFLRSGLKPLSEKEVIGNRSLSFSQPASFYRNL